MRRHWGPFSTKNILFVKYVCMFSFYQEMDKGNRGYIKIEQMAELYRIYKVIVK
jgi:hypothetical protein